MPLTNRPLTILLFAWCCLCLHPGCIALPIPQAHRNIEREGKKIEKTRLSFVVPGQTTKAEFIDQIGQPYLMMDDWGVMAYYWKMLAAYVVVVTYGAAGIPEVTPQYLLLVSYDDQGVIDRYEIVRNIFYSSKTVNERALQWAGKDAALGRKFTPVSPPAGKSVVYIFQRPPQEFPPLHINGVFLDDHLWAELQWDQYTPMIVPPGSHTIGFEPDIRKTDKFLHPHRQATAPSLTTIIDIVPNQAYYLEISFIERDSRDFKKTAIFSRLSEGVALPKLAQLKRAR